MGLNLTPPPPRGANLVSKTLALYSAEAIIDCHIEYVGTLAVDGWAVIFGTARRGLGGGAARPVPSSLYQMSQPTHQRPLYHHRIAV